MNNLATALLRHGSRTRLCLYGWLVCQAAVAGSAVLTLRTLGGFPGSRPDGELHGLADTVSGTTATISVFAYLVTAGMVLGWVYRSARVARTLSDRVTVTPGWAVGRFFVPVINLWKPFQGVAEIWRASVDPVAPDDVPTPVLLRLWWGLWLASGLFGHIGGRLALRAETPRSFIDAAWADLVLFACNVPLVVLLVRIVTDLSAMQATLLTRTAGAIDDGHAS